jgi:hypothetical protein
VLFHADERSIIMRIVSGIAKFLPILSAPAIAALTIISAAPFSTPAFAIKGDYARFEACQQLKSTHSVKWYGIASGTEDDAFALFENSRSFHTKACFSNERDCRNWVKRIWWEIPTMEELRVAYCKQL